MVFIVALSCGVKEQTDKGRLLARVYDNRLFVADLGDILSENVSSEDSALVVNAYIERWVRDAVMLREAEVNMPPDLNVEFLVSDYRASLLRDNYEKILLETSLDSIISREEISAFYDGDRSLFMLPNEVVRCYYLKVPESSDLDKQVSTIWDDDVGSSELLKIVTGSQAQYLLDDSTWYAWNHILSWLPGDIEDEKTLKIGKSWTASNDAQRYYLLVFERVEKGESAPLNYVRDQIEKLILHQRKIRIIEKKKEELLKHEAKNNNVKIYTR